MERSNDLNNNNNNNYNKRTIALGRPPLPPTRERMTGQSSQNPNLDPEKLKRMLANRRYAKTHHLKQTCRIMKLEWTVQRLEGDVARYSEQIYCLKRQGDLLLVENGESKQKFSFYSREIEFKEAQSVKLKKEKNELKELYVGQQQGYEVLMKSNMTNAQSMMDMDQLGRLTYNFM